MLNDLWAAMLILGIVYGTLQGRLPELTEAALTSAGEAVNLCVTMAGIMALWVGVMEIAQKSGIIGRVSRVIGPFLDFMFPRLPREHPAREYITTNVIANIFGLGWAATPAGLKAMEALSDLEEERRKDRTAGAEKGDGQQRNVYFSGAEYRVFAADSGEYHRLSEPVRQCESGCDSGSFAGGDADQRRGGGGVL